MQSFDMEKMLAAAFTDARRAFFRLFPLFLLIGVSVNLINARLMPAPIDGAPPAVAFGPLIAFMCVAFFAFAVQVAVGAQMMNGRDMRLGAAVMHALRRFPVLLVALVGYYLAVAVGMLLLIIPGVILMVTLAYAWFAALLDDHGPVSALRASFRLTWGNAWQVVGANLLVGLAYALALLLVFALLPGSAQDLVALLVDSNAYADWRRWTFDLVASAFGILYLFLNLHIYAELKRLKHGDTDAEEPRAPAIVRA